MNNVTKAARRLLADIDAMRKSMPGELKPDMWFGPFHESRIEDDDWLDWMIIEWPNLAISADALREALWKDRNP